jgi:tetratricopeptide (TPR) repeat protein
MPLQFRSPRAPWLVLPLLLIACRMSGDSTRGAARQIEDMLTRGQFEQAVREAAELRERRRDDAESLVLHKKATLAWMLDQCRRLTFEEQDAEALELFRQAAALVPESEQARIWVLKTERKLGTHWLVTADELHADGALEGALEAYEKALSYEPELLAAREGAAQIDLLLNYREGLSNRYYNEGVRALHDYFLRISRGRFQYTRKYQKGHERASHREEEVISLLSEERFALARKFEDEGMWAAARNEYHIVLLMDPDNEQAQEGHARTKVEAKARRKMSEASMFVIREDFGRAREILEEGLELSSIQDALFEDALANLDDQRIEARYQRALTMEHDFQYREAITAFQAILDERQWYKDARTRLSTLEGTVARVERTYQEAARATSVEERRRKLREILIDWPDYRDVPDQLAALPAPPPVVEPVIEE